MKTRNIHLIIIIIIFFSNCTSNPTRNNNQDFSTIENAKVEKAFACIIDDEIESIQIINNKIWIKNSNASPLFSSYNNDYTVSESFGEIGHGHEEFLMPNILGGDNDSLLIIDNETRRIYTVFGNKICKNRKTSMKELVNKVKTICYPYVGFHSFMENAINWNVCNIKNDSIVSTVVFVDDNNTKKPSLNAFTWDSKDHNVVFASKYYDKFRIIQLSPKDMSIQSDIEIINSDNTPKENKCYYTGVGCGKYIYLLSQKNIEPTIFSGHSELEVYSYDGKPIKKIILDGLYFQMAIDNKQNKIYLVSPYKSEILYINI